MKSYCVIYSHTLRRPTFRMSVPHVVKWNNIIYVVVAMVLIMLMTMSIPCRVDRSTVIGKHCQDIATYHRMDRYQIHFSFSLRLGLTTIRYLNYSQHEGAQYILNIGLYIHNLTTLSLSVTRPCVDFIHFTVMYLVFPARVYRESLLN